MNQRYIDYIVDAAQQISAERMRLNAAWDALEASLAPFGADLTTLINERNGIEVRERGITVTPRPPAEPVAPTPLDAEPLYQTDRPAEPEPEPTPSTHEQIREREQEARDEAPEPPQTQRSGEAQTWRSPIIEAEQRRRIVYLAVEAMSNLTVQELIKLLGVKDNDANRGKYGDDLRALVKRGSLYDAGSRYPEGTKVGKKSRSYSIQGPFRDRDGNEWDDSPAYDKDLALPPR